MPLTKCHLLSVMAEFDGRPKTPEALDRFKQIQRLINLGYIEPLVKLAWGIATVEDRETVMTVDHVNRAWGYLQAGTEKDALARHASASAAGTSGSSSSA